MSPRLLPTSFDYCLVGTSLPLAILACALSRTSSVLHVDENSYYGEEYCYEVDFGGSPTTINTKYGKGVFVGNDATGVSLGDPKLNHGRSWGIMFAPEYSRGMKRHLSPPNMVPVFLYGSGEGVKATIDSGISDYLDFNNIAEVLYYGINGQFNKVPSGKNEIFADGSLSAIDKRRVMKVCRLCYDLSREDSDAGTSCLHANQKDNELRRSRSLNRPQNAPKPTPTLANCLGEEEDFKAFLLKSCNFKSDSDACNLVCYALTLSPDPNPTTHSAVSLINKQASSIGIYTSTMIAPMYGSGEFPQGFCRRAAVNGAVYVMRTNVRVGNGEVVLDSNEDDEMGGEKEKMFENEKVNVKRCFMIANGGTRMICRVSALMRKHGGVSGHTLDGDGRIFVFPPTESYANPIHVVSGGRKLRWTEDDDYVWLTSSTMYEKEAGTRVNNGGIDKAAAIESSMRAISAITGDGWLLVWTSTSCVPSGRGKDELEKDDDFVVKVSRPGHDLSLDSALIEARRVYNYIKAKDGLEKEFIEKDAAERLEEDDFEDGEGDMMARAMEGLSAEAIDVDIDVDAQQSVKEGS